MLDFGGKKLNFIQIGLGTNCTFIHNLVGSPKEYNKSLGFYFNATSEHDPEHVLGIAVEPVASLADAIRPLAGKMPGVQVLQAAMGEYDKDGAEMKGLSLEARDYLVSQVPESQRQKITQELEYMCNMSCLDYCHPLLPMCQAAIQHDYNLKLEVGTEKVDVWSWAKLAQTFNFVGCEIVLVDAEGCDTKILRSLISFCREHPEHWPDIIQLETMGHCDRQEGAGAEKALLDSFEQEGYTIVAMSDHNSHVMKTSALEKERRYQIWVYKWFCYLCYGQWRMPYVSNKKGIFCKDCYDWMVERGKTKPLKIAGDCGLDDLSKMSPHWGERESGEEWWNHGLHWRALDWKPWERESECKKTVRKAIRKKGSSPLKRPASLLPATRKHQLKKLRKPKPRAVAKAKPKANKSKTIAKRPAARI